MVAKRYKETALRYAEEIVSGRKIAGKEIVAACRRFLDDLQRPDLELREGPADTCISFIEGVFVHRKGETLDGTPLLGQPFLLEPWEIFIIYNLLGFYYKGTEERRYKEALLNLGRKNGKTSLIASLSFAISMMQRRSGSTVYVVAASLKQALESFQFIEFSLRYKKIIGQFEVKDNSFEHSIKRTFLKDGRTEGSIDIQIMAANPDAQDSFNCNFAIADEVAAYKSPAQYNRFKEAMKAYQNKLMIGITTAGDNVNSFGYQQIEYAAKVATGVVKDDGFFSFVARADKDSKGNVDFTNPVQHEKANPNYGVTIRPQEILRESLQAQNNPQQRKDFFSRSLNIYTSAMRAWFDLEEFKASDRKYSWTLDELAKLKIDWYGGADLSRMYDLTAAALYGRYEDTEIVITHAFFPITQAARKAEEDHIPLYGWEDDGWLTMCNSPTVNIGDVVNWFVDMREKGFRIRGVGHDRKFAGEEYFPEMIRAGFHVEDQPQYFYVKSQGFRHIEKAVKDGRLYYLHSEAYEYCVANVRAVEKTDDAVQYEKIQPEHRIDLFDASVFACVQMIKADARTKKAKAWWSE